MLYMYKEIDETQGVRWDRLHTYKFCEHLSLEPRRCRAVVPLHAAKASEFRMGVALHPHRRCSRSRAGIERVAA